VLENWFGLIRFADARALKAYVAPRRSSAPPASARS
jgi:hypothetical protein